MALTKEEQSEMTALQNEIIISKGERIGTCKKDADVARKTRLRDLYAKRAN
jgi:hypothetical protein